jgi:formylglycine-generating enzyme required for sulfatase activity
MGKQGLGGVLVAALLLMALHDSHAQGRASAVRVICEGQAAGAEITINGKYRGDCPLDVEVQPGNIELTAVKKVDPLRERRFTTRFGIGEAAAKRVEVQLGPAELNAEGRRQEAERQRAEAERRRLEEERKRAEAEAKRKADEERARAQAAAAARQAELRRLAGEQSEQRRRERAAVVNKAFAEAGLVSGDGKAFKDCPECPEMVWIPPGRTPQIAGTSETQRWYNRFELLAPIAVGKFEVTFAEWDACVAAGGCSRAPAEGFTEGIIFDSKWGRGRQPVINISWRDAQQYVAWLSKRTGQPYRLLSQIEFQYASRAGAATTWPWGDELKAGAANCTGCGGKSTDRSLAVGSFPPNAWGLHDMMGNVAEFVADCYGSRAHGGPSVSWQTWVRLSEQPADGSPLDLCSAAPGRTAVIDPAFGFVGPRFNAANTPPLVLAQWTADTATYNSTGLRVARDFVVSAPAIDPASLKPYRDCATCPELVNLPGGRFEMGTPYLSPEGATDSEHPLRWVTVKPFAIGRVEVTREQWEAFERARAQAAPAPAAGSTAPAAPAAATGCVPVQTGANGTTIVFGALNPSLSTLAPGFAQGANHPAVCVSRQDAKAYLEWLSSTTGKMYRLPTEAEWEYAARAGSSDRTPWRRDGTRACEFANLRDEAFERAFAQNVSRPCSDNFAYTAPVGHFRPNAWGLSDMLGNAAEHVEDCWQPNYNNEPSDGSARVVPQCSVFVTRGGSWYLPSGSLLTHAPGRGSRGQAWRDGVTGLRVARDLDAAK